MHRSRIFFIPIDLENFVYMEENEKWKENLDGEIYENLIVENLELEEEDLDYGKREREKLKQKLYFSYIIHLLEDEELNLLYLVYYLKLPIYKIDIILADSKKQKKNILYKKLNKVLGKIQLLRKIFQLPLLKLKEKYKNEFYFLMALLLQLPLDVIKREFNLSYFLILEKKKKLSKDLKKEYNFDFEYGGKKGRRIVFFDNIKSNVREFIDKVMEVYKKIKEMEIWVENQV